MSKVTDIIEDLRNIEDLAGPAQEVLVSGDNIKTVGGQSLLGAGDVELTTVNNTLTSTSTTEALSAAQGKVLEDNKQATLVSGTNIKTINGESLLGNGNISILPDQTANDGKFLKTDGVNTSWEAIDGKVLLATINASNSTTVDFDGLFTSEYDDYVVYGDNIKVQTDERSICFHFQSNGSWLTGNDYTEVTTNQGSTGRHSTPYITPSIGKTTGARADFVLRITRPLSTSEYKFAAAKSYAFRSGNGFTYRDKSFCYLQTTIAVTGIRFYADYQNISSGKFRLYGIKK